MLKTALVIKGRRGLELFRLFRECREIDLVALACPEGKPALPAEFERKELFITADLNKIAALPEVEAVVDATGEAATAAFFRQTLREGVRLEILHPQSALGAMLQSMEQFMETRLARSELQATLNAVQDAVEIVDERGIVKYVNPAFTRVTGIPEKGRLGRSIFEVSPHGALAHSLIQQKPVTGYRTYVGGSEADVISNASPIIVDYRLMGAVVVFKPVGDILRLMDELKHSNTVIDNLYAQIDQLSKSRFGFEALIGQSRAFTAAVENARRAARGDSAILISGESGTGKSLFARAIHNHSSRRKKPLIVVDCAAVPDSLQEIEIFGCEKGAMPGVLRTRLGKLELAGGSTLFIKEINSLNPFLQKQVLKVIDEGQFYRIGAEKPLRAEVRIVASAGDNLLNFSLQGHFSEELYRRLSRVTVSLPPLRKRPEDIPLLAEALMDHLNRKLGKKITGLSPRALQELVEYDWPGNISELRSVIERSMVVADGRLIEYHHLSLYIGRTAAAEAPVFDRVIPLDRMEEMMLKLALTRYGETLEGKKKAARALNISLATLYNKLKKYNR